MHVSMKEPAVLDDGASHDLVSTPDPSSVAVMVADTGAFCATGFGTTAAWTVGAVPSAFTTICVCAVRRRLSCTSPATTWPSESVSDRVTGAGHSMTVTPDEHWNDTVTGVRLQVPT